MELCGFGLHRMNYAQSNWRQRARNCQRLSGFGACSMLQSRDANFKLGHHRFFSCGSLQNLAGYRVGETREARRAGCDTFGNVTSGSGEWFGDELLVATQLRGCGFREQREGNHAAAFRHFRCREGIADYRGHLLQTSLPARLAGVAENQTVAMKASSSKYGASQLQKAGPARCDGDERV